MADRINEIKRRKDIVEKIVGDRRRTDVSVSLFFGTIPLLCVESPSHELTMRHLYFPLLIVSRWCKLDEKLELRIECLSLVLFTCFFFTCRHGINKTFTRRAQKFKQATGIAAEGTQDAFFDALNVKFEEQQETARQLARDVQGWLRHVKENFESMYQLAVSLEDLYTSWGGVTVKSLERIKAFKDCAVSLTTSLSRELVKKSVSFHFVRFHHPVYCS